jgi:hypothetical protein
MRADEGIFVEGKTIAKGQSKNRLISHHQHCTLPLL